eukprot:EG_transcript_23266
MESIRYDSLDAAAFTAGSVLLFLLVVEPAMKVLADALPLKGKRRSKVANSLSSLVHSTVAGLWSNALLGPMLLRSHFSLQLSLLKDAAPTSFFSPTHAIAFSTGYFIFDTISMHRAGLFAGSPAMLAHHIVVPLCFGAAMWKGLYTPLLAITLMCELNSLGLHARIVLRSLEDGCWAGLEAVRRAAYWFAIGTFAVFRLTAHPYVLAYMLTHYDAFDVKWHYWVGLTGTVAINALNVVFGISIIQAERRTVAKAGLAR